MLHLDGRLALALALAGRLVLALALAGRLVLALTLAGGRDPRSVDLGPCESGIHVSGFGRRDPHMWIPNPRRVRFHAAHTQQTACADCCTPNSLNKLTYDT